jgi:hypothetical protein
MSFAVLRSLIASTAPSDSHDLSTHDSPPRTFSMQNMSSRPSHRSHDSGSSTEEAGGIPLIDFSRTPSPTPYRSRGGSRSGAGTDDEDDDIQLSLRPLVAPQQGKGWNRIWTSGGLGHFLFGTWTGWQVYVAVLMLYVGAVEYTLTLLNRFILWSKFLCGVVLFVRSN